MPDTWEEAAIEAADSILAVVEPAVDLDEVDRHLDTLGPTSYWRLVRIGAFALQRAGGTREALDAVIATIIAKQHDYGHGNILRHGITGIVVRMCDKVERIRNLEKRGAALTRTTVNDFGEEIAENEPLSDSWGDLVGYSIVGIMLLNGTFTLPLAQDIEQPQEDRLEKLDDLMVLMDTAALTVTCENGNIYRWSVATNSWLYSGRVPNVSEHHGAQR